MKRSPTTTLLLGMLVFAACEQRRDVPHRCTAAQPLTLAGGGGLRLFDESQSSEPEWLPLSGLVVRTGDVVPVDSHHVPFAEGGPPLPHVMKLEDGTVLAITGGGQWWESSTLFLELCTNETPPLVQALSIRWSADVPPFSAWLLDVGGTITIDHSVVPTRVAYDVTGKRDPTESMGYRMHGSFVLEVDESSQSAPIGDRYDEYCERRPNQPLQADQASPDH